VDYKYAKSSFTGQSYFSTKMTYEFDCKNFNYRIFDVSQYSENMARGIRVFIAKGKVRNWQNISKLSIENLIISKVCITKK
tara:strand:- start:836 stop:1078 length:243 start_codon:yes stop_codon:yes gene_type:complete